MVGRSRVLPAVVLGCGLLAPPAAVGFDDAAQAPGPRAEGRALHAAQRPDGAAPRGPQDAGGRGRRLLQGRLQGREARQDRLRPPVRAHDVPGLEASRRRLLAAAGDARRRDQRHDRRGPDRVLRAGPQQRARAGPLARGRSHGLPAAGDDAAEARQRAGRGQERASRARGQRPVWPGRRGDPRGTLPRRTTPTGTA